MGLNLDLENSLNKINDFVWGWPLLILLVGTGIFLTFRLSFLQLSQLPYALKLAFSRKQDQKSEGDISHFQSLMTALAATIGIGNIVGVAGAILVGGPGAVFWMWITAIFGMATKYGEAILAVKYRITNTRGEMSGGPMYYIERGLGWKWLAVLFALFGAIAAFGIGNTTQSNSVAGSLNELAGVPHWVTGIVLAVLTGLVILGGIKSIGRVTSYLVPFMAVLYMIGGLVIILLNIEKVPAALGLIFNDAFTGQAVAGGAIGLVIQKGVARGLFSNEAGLGSAPIAAAAAKTDHPGRQALVSMTGTFLDTIIVCSITGLTIVMTEAYLLNVPDAAITMNAFSSSLGNIGGLIVSLGIMLFAYSTIIGWAYYGEKCFTYLFSDKAIYIYRSVFVVFIFFGAILDLKIVWTFAEIMNGLMALPNLIALLFLSGVIVAETKDFRKKLKLEQAEKKTASTN